MSHIPLPVVTNSYSPAVDHLPNSASQVPVDTPPGSQNIPPSNPAPIPVANPAPSQPPASTASTPSHSQPLPAPLSKSEITSSFNLLTKERIEQLARTVDPNLNLDEDVQDFLQHYAADLLDEVASMSAKIAQARKSKTLDVQDVRFYLERNWNMFIPGFGADPIRAKRKLTETEAHKNRQAIIKKHLKKF